MKRIIFVLLMLLLFCSCGANGRDCDVPLPPPKLSEISGSGFVEDGKFEAPPQPPELSEISGKGITVTESFVAEETEEIYEKFIIQKWENESWVLVKPFDENKETAVSYFAKEGEVSKFRIDFTEFYGELPKGKYRLVLGFVEPEESGKFKNTFYSKIEFEIE